MSWRDWTPQFWVTLLRVRRALSEDERRDLEANCTHVTGAFWIFEGDYDPESIGFFHATEPIAEGAVGCLGELDEATLIDICRRSFDVRLEPGQEMSP